MSDEIQQARDVLAKWRTNKSGSWYGVDAGGFADVFCGDERVALSVAPEDARLIVGTAGNTDLLDAIDRLLQTSDPGNPFMYDPWDDESVDPTNTGEVVQAAVSAGWSAGAYALAEGIAAAIIAADGRMNA